MSTAAERIVRIAGETRLVTVEKHTTSADRTVHATEV